MTSISIDVRLFVPPRPPSPDGGDGATRERGGGVLPGKWNVRQTIPDDRSKLHADQDDDQPHPRIFVGDFRPDSVDKPGLGDR